MRLLLFSSPLFLTACTIDEPPKYVPSPPSVNIVSINNENVDPDSNGVTPSIEVREGTEVIINSTISDIDGNDVFSALTINFYAGDTKIWDNQAGYDSCDGIEASGEIDMTCRWTAEMGITTLTLQVEDTYQLDGQDSASIIVIPDNAPSIEIIAPNETGEYYDDIPISLEAMVSDLEDTENLLTVTWVSDLDGTVATEQATSDGHALSSARLSEGTHVLEAVVTDSFGGTGSDSVILTVHGANTTPVCGFNTPATGATFVLGEPVIFEGSAIDAETAPEQLTVSLESSLDGLLSANVPVTSSGDFIWAQNSLSTGAHVITLTAVDPRQATCTETLLIEVCDTIWYADTDGDGYGQAGMTSISCDAPPGYVADHTDCDDTNSAVFPDTDEICNGTDDNCDGVVDESTSVNAQTWYLDTDRDNYGNVAVSIVSCSQPPGYVNDSTDCNDASNIANPAGTEVCDSLDNNCDGRVDEATATDAQTWYADTDSDNFGDPAVSQRACTQPVGYVSRNTDCDDTRALTYPGVVEYCNGYDDNCNGTVDENTAVDVSTWYVDADSDGYGNRTSTVRACTQPAGYVSDNTDCNDAINTTYPGALEYCNSSDDDCDGTVDENTAVDALTWYLDADSDGYGLSNVTIVSCTPPALYIGVSGDCDDGVTEISPASTEVCDGIDNNCDSFVDEGSSDTDNDGIVDCLDVCPVYAGPNGISGTGEEANPYDGINEAIALRGDYCDDIVVLPGIYEEVVDLGTEEVNITGWYYYHYGSWRNIMDITEFISCVSESACSDSTQPSTVDVDCGGIDSRADISNSIQSFIAPSQGLANGPAVIINGGQTSATSIKGLTLWGGTGYSDGQYTSGGGLYVYDSDPLIESNIIRCNEATGSGGGGALVSYDGLFSDNIIQYNQVTDFTLGGGGGLVLGRNSPQIYNNYIISNSSLVGSMDGGGIQIVGSGATEAIIVSNWIEDNATADRGAGIRSGGARPIILNNIVVRNQGIGIHLSNGDAGVVANNTIADNWSSGIRTEVTNSSGSPTTAIINNIIYSNDGYGLYLLNSSTHSSITYNDVYGNTSGNWYDIANTSSTLPALNISVNPAILSTTSYSGYCLLHGSSPCINAGSTGAWLNGFLSTYSVSLSVDYEGDPRNDPWDIGACEY